MIEIEIVWWGGVAWAAGRPAGRPESDAEKRVVCIRVGWLCHTRQGGQQVGKFFV